jgi:hypothetical protein
VQSQQLPTESQVLEDEVLPGTENADQPTEEMSERCDHSRNHIGKVGIELCAKSFILQVYDVLAKHKAHQGLCPRSPRPKRLIWFSRGGEFLGMGNQYVEARIAAKRFEIGVFFNP